MNLSDIPKVSIQTISEYPTACRNKFLRVALSILHSPNQERTKTLEKLSNEFQLNFSDINLLLGALIAIIKLFIDYDDREFNLKLSEIGFPANFIEELPLIGNRSEIINAITTARTAHFQQFDSLDWRIDVSLRDSDLVKKVPPNIILCFKLKDGSSITIHLDIKGFHKLRFNFAMILKEINLLKTCHLLSK